MSTCLAAISAVDWSIVGAYGVAVILIALWSKRRQKSSDDYVMAGRRLPWWLVGISIIATAFSTISLLLWTGKGYVDGLRWFQLQTGEVAAIVVVCLLFLPFFSRLKLTTAYEYLERRFGPRARWFGSLLFHIQVLARAGLFLYLTARALAVFTEIDVETSILIVGLAAMLYSSTGGLGAVVWTDLVQLVLVLTGVTTCIVMILGDLPGGMADVTALLRDPARPPALDLGGDLDAWPTFWSGLVAYGVLALGVAGTNQQAVQRYMACEDLKGARRAAVLSWAIGAVMVLLTLGMGIALYARYDGAAIHPNDVFTTFVRDGLPTGVVGLMVAAVFAASMSSIDSAIHAMSTATLVDFVERFRRRQLAERTRMRVARGLTLAYGVLAVGAAFYAMAQGRDVLDQLLAWLGFLSGPVLGLFLLGMVTRSVREAPALVGVVAGYVAVTLGTEGGVFAAAGVHGIWAATVGCGVTFLVGLLASWCVRLWPWAWARLTARRR